MPGAGTTIVIDIGKTLSKVTLWSTHGECLDRQVRPNAPGMQEGLQRLDRKGIETWLIAALARYAGHPVTAIVPVAHGAGVVVLGSEGPLVEPLDYEQPIPPDVMAAYRAERDAFAMTGSPALPQGLNLGAQLSWHEQLHPDAMAAATLVPWAQYWAWFLTGKAVSEVTTLGCHSDLWLPAEARFALLAERMGWAARFAPMAKAGDTVGTLRPEMAAATGLPRAVRVLAGLHDSNAALLAARGFAEIAGHDATVLSTGTWFIAMRSPAPGSASPDLPEGRDCLINVDVEGRAVPSARFMGGREIESVIQIDTRQVDITPDQPALLAAVPGLLAAGTMLLPTLAPGCGPFPHYTAQWIAEPDDWYAKRAAMCLYAALVTDAALHLIGAQGRLLVEGRFAEAQVFVRALAALRPDMQVFTANAHNDVSFGALRLVHPELRPRTKLSRVQPLEHDLNAYRKSWHHNIQERA